MMLILTTGGTIDKVYFDANSEYEIGEPTIETIFREAGVNAPFRLISLLRKDSLELTDADRKLIHQTVAEAPESQVLITHGTDTMAMTAELLRDIPNKCIVLTGAMSPARFRVTDAIFNVGFALGALATQQKGVYLAMNGQLFKAGEVVKNLAAKRFEALPPQS